MVGWEEPANPATHLSSESALCVATTDQLPFGFFFTEYRQTGAWDGFGARTTGVFGYDN